MAGYYDAMGQWHEDPGQPYDTGGQVFDSSRGTQAPTFSLPVQDKAQAAPSEWGNWRPPDGTQAPAEYWIPPTASFGDDPSGVTNRQNPFADPGRPFVQAGTTGGYQVGVGITRRAGTSQTQAEYDAAVAAARSSPWAGQLDQWLKTNPDDEHRFLKAMQSEWQGAGEGLTREQSEAMQRGTGGSSAGGRQPHTPQFGSPGQGLLENYALDRFGQLTNPDPNSGSAIFEQYAKQLIDTLKGPVYSAGDESVIKGSALDSIERDRAATKQRWLEEIGRRGHMPSSGVALQGLQQIENQFNQYRTTVDAQFAKNAIDQTRQQRFQVLGTAGQLAQAQEGRLDKASTYAGIPYNLEQDAFNRNLSLVGAGGSPASTLQSALMLLNANQQANAYSSAQRAQMTDGIMQYLGFLFG